MKTKYIKVEVIERLPKEDGNYFVWVDNPNARSKSNPAEYNMDKKKYYQPDNEFQSFYDVTHWLEEIPDKEEEMIEMLEEMIGYIPYSLKSKYKEKLQSLKQTK